MGNVKKGIARIVRRLIPEMWFERLWSFYVDHNKKYSEDRYKYAYFKKGKKSKERYCILRFFAPTHGIMAVARWCLLACEWAEHHGMIPLIDYELEYYFKHDMVGKENMWDYVFEQKASVQEVYKQNSVFVGERGKIYFLPSMSEKLFGSREEYHIRFADKNWRDYYKQLNVYSNKWWILRPEIKERFEKKYAELFKPEMKILGVALRELFSQKREEIENTILIDHPHEPQLEDMIELIKEYKEKWQCTHIFVSTIRKDSIHALEKEFGNALIYIERGRSNSEEELYYHSIQEKYGHSPDEYYLRTREDEQIAKTFKKEWIVGYVEEIYGISKCNCLLSSKSGGSITACIWNGGKYEELKILEDDNKSFWY